MSTTTLTTGNVKTSGTAAGISAAALHALLLQPEEVALIDVREALDFGRAHINLARHVALSSLAVHAAQVISRATVPIVLCAYDDTDAPVTDRAYRLLNQLGYADIRILEGGVKAWSASYPVSSGYNTLVKAFADEVRVHFNTPAITARALHARLTSQPSTITVIDARPADEYAFAAIPDARNYPGTELPTRNLTAKDPEHVWAINCFSRTRGIIGTTTLRVLLGVEQVTWVEDGVMSWVVNGLQHTEKSLPVDDIPQQNAAQLSQSASSIITRYGLKTLDTQALKALYSDASRTLSVFDIRPLTTRLSDQQQRAGVQHVPGGQLVMNYENYVGVRNSRIVLTGEPHLLDSAVTAFWLTQLGEAEIFILSAPWPADLDSIPSAQASVKPWQQLYGTSSIQASSISAAQLQAALASTNAPLVVDVSASALYIKGHIPAALFALPADFVWFAAIAGQPVVITSTDGQLARFVAQTLAFDGHTVAWLQGGNLAWQAAGYPVKPDYLPEHLLTPFWDNWGSTMRISGEEKLPAYQRYLDWEANLSSQVAKDDTVSFRFFKGC